MYCAPSVHIVLSTGALNVFRTLPLVVPTRVSWSMHTDVTAVAPGTEALMSQDRSASRLPATSRGT